MTVELRRPSVERSPRAGTAAAEPFAAAVAAAATAASSRDERVVAVLESILAEQRHLSSRHEELINLELRAMESQRASSRKLRVALWLVAIVVPLSVILGQVLPTLLAVARR